MESFDYKKLGETIPPSPIISIRLTAPDWLERSSGKFVDCEALLDTGADFTLIPLEMVSILQLEVIEFSVPIDGIGGGTAYGYGCYANFKLGQQSLRAIRVYGCERSLIGNLVIIGRNLMNECCFEFDGINQQLTLKQVQ